MKTITIKSDKKIKSFCQCDVCRSKVHRSYPSAVAAGYDVLPSGYYSKKFLGERMLCPKCNYYRWVKLSELPSE